MFSRRTSWSRVPNQFTEALRQAQERGDILLDLTISNPTRAGIAYDEKAIVNSLANADSVHYDPHPNGILSARQSVADYYRDRGEHVDPDNLVLTASTSEGYSYVFRLLANPGDEILVPKPSYPLFEFLADLQDVTLVPYPLIYDHGWQIDLHSLAKAISAKTRAVVAVHPNNPTGSYVSATQRSRMNAMCAGHEIALIVDEVFLDYSLGNKHVPSFAANRDALTFTLSGLSKISALPQMKFSWLAISGPRELAQEALARLEVIADTYLSVSTPVQLAAPALIAQRKNIQLQLLERVQRNLQELDRQLARYSCCARLEVEGGWYAVLRVPATQSDEDLTVGLMRNREVLVHPGHFYDFPADGYLVLSLITEPQTFKEGIARILQYF